MNEFKVSNIELLSIRKRFLFISILPIVMAIGYYKYSIIPPLSLISGTAIIHFFLFYLAKRAISRSESTVLIVTENYIQRNIGNEKNIYQFIDLTESKFVSKKGKLLVIDLSFGSNGLSLKGFNDFEKLSEMIQIHSVPENTNKQHQRKDYGEAIGYGAIIIFFVLFFITPFNIWLSKTILASIFIYFGYFKKIGSRNGNYSRKSEVILTTASVLIQISLLIMK